MFRVCILGLFFVILSPNGYSATVPPLLRVLGQRIVGGKETSITVHPYQAAIQYFGYHYCGAAVISDKFVLTAAHCMFR